MDLTWDKNKKEWFVIFQKQIITKFQIESYKQTFG